MAGLALAVVLAFSLLQPWMGPALAKDPQSAPGAESNNTPATHLWETLAGQMKQWQEGAAAGHGSVKAAALYRQSLEANGKESLDLLMAAIKQAIDDGDELGEGALCAELYEIASDVEPDADFTHTLLLRALHGLAARGDALLVAYLRQDLGVYLAEHGRFGEAIEPLEGALAVFRQRQLAMATAMCSQNLGLVYLNVGRYGDAEAALGQALEYMEHQGLQAEAAEARQNLGLVYMDQGRYEAAVGRFQEAMAIFRQLHDDWGIARVLANLGIIYTEQSRYAEGTQSFQEALAIFQRLKMDQKVAEMWGNLGIIYERTERLEEALQAYQQAMEVFRQRHMDANVANMWQNVGVVYRKQGKYQKAARAYQEALKIYEAQGMQNRAAEVWLNLGVVYSHQGVHEAAVAAYEKALDFFERQGMLDRQLSAHEDLAQSLGTMGRLREAIRHGTAALALLDRVQREAFYSGGEAAALALGARHEVLYPKTAGWQITQGEETGAYETLVRGQGRLLSVTRLRAAMAATTPEAKAALEALRQSQTRMTALQGEISAAGSEEERQRLLAEMQSLDRQAEAQEVALSKATRTFELVHDPAAAEVQAALPPKTALLQYAYLPDGLHLFVLTGSAFRHLRLLRDVDALQTQVSHFRETLSQRPGTFGRTSVKSMGKALYRALVEPAEPYLAGIDHLVIVPEDQLQFVPFEALVDGEGRYALERWTISYLNTPRELFRETAPGNASLSPGQDVVMGGAVYSQGPQGANGATPAPGAAGSPAANPGQGLRNGGAPWPDLENTRAEAQAVAEVLRATPLLGLQATETVFKGQAPRSRYVLVATHGYVAEDLPPSAGQPAAEDPLERLKNSGIVFSGVNVGGDGQDDGDLTAYEVLGLHLEGVKLVVLSACDTGLGLVHGGEGVFGLKRAFLVAGAERLVLSLWKVNDEATRALMVSLFQHVAGGTPPSQALRDAQLALLASPKLQDPFYWAPFILVGAP